MASEQEINFLRRNDPVDLGLNTGDIKATRQTLQKLKQHPSYPQGYDVALKQVLDEQNRVAALRETERQLKGAQIMVTRRDFTKLMLKLAGLSVVAGGGFTVISAINQSFFSPESVARREEENRINQEANRQKQEQEQERLDKIKSENARALGLTPSAISARGFRIRYNPPGRNARYVDVGGELGNFTVAKGNFIEWQEQQDDKKVKIPTSIFFSDPYTRVQDSVKVPKIVVRVQDSLDETWYLRDVPSENIDNSVIVFEDVNNRKEYIWVVSNPEGNLTQYQFRLMRKEPVRPR